MARAITHSATGGWGEGSPSSGARPSGDTLDEAEEKTTPSSAIRATRRERYRYRQQDRAAHRPLSTPRNRPGQRTRERSERGAGPYLVYNQTTPQMTSFPQLGLTKSGVACWWSINRLIETRSPCHLWTLTVKSVYPDSYYGNMHRNLMRSLRDDVRAGRMDKNCWGGVRVTEISPKGHGLHIHWIIAGRIPIRLILRRATEAGFGRIHVDPRPVTPLAANYLAKYLNKRHGQLNDGIRKWACIGNYDGVKTRDVQFESKSADVFRAAFREEIARGVHKHVAFARAKIAQRKYDFDE